MFPFKSISIFSAAGVAGRPGIRIISPAIGIIKPAPVASSISLMLTVKSVGRPVSDELSESEFCVFAIQIAKFENPSFLIR